MPANITNEIVLMRKCDNKLAIRGCPNAPYLHIVRSTFYVPTLEFKSVEYNFTNEIIKAFPLTPKWFITIGFKSV